MWPEEHGILDNFMYDASQNIVFQGGEQASDFKSFWWNEREAIWSSASQQVSFFTKFIFCIFYEVYLILDAFINHMV